jgi:hypothetical protein
LDFIEQSRPLRRINARPLSAHLRERFVSGKTDHLRVPRFGRNAQQLVVVRPVGARFESQPFPIRVKRVQLVPPLPWLLRFPLAHLLHNTALSTATQGNGQESPAAAIEPTSQPPAHLGSFA